MTHIINFIVAVYIRLSKEDGDKEESDSITNQRKMLMSYIDAREEFRFYDYYIDDGFTGTNFNRPAFKRLMNDIEKGHVNCVIVKDLSRFGRDYIDTGRYLERYFPDNDIRFIAVTDNIDSFKQAYDMLLPIKNIFNEQYARDISKKVQSSFKVKQKEGEFIGAFPSYGYKKSPIDRHKLVVDEYAAEVVRRIYNNYISGYGKVRIAKILNDEGIVCPSEYKKLNGENYRNCNKLNQTSYWTYSTIHKILQNQMYVGHMVQGKTKRRMKGKAKTQNMDNWIIVENTHEAIIDDSTWYTVQNLLNKRTRELDLQNNLGIFAGFLKCPDCGRALVKKTTANKKIYYTCGTYNRIGKNYCSPHSVSHDLLEQIVLKDLKILIQNVDNLQDIIQQQQKSESYQKRNFEKELFILNGELNKISKLKKSLYEDMKDNLISKNEYLNYRQDYLNQEVVIQNKTDMLKEKQQDPPDIFKNFWIKKLLEFKSIDKLDRETVVELIHAIYIYENNKIQLCYNFSGELNNLFQVNYEMGLTY